MKKPSRPLGRPTDYKPEFADTAKKLCQILGATDNQVADILGKSLATINNWKIEHPEFLDALKLGKEASDNRVEKSLYERALGYSHPAVKIFANPKTGENVKVEYIERYPPDTTACIFWLKNRKKDEWRERSASESDLTPDQLALIAASPKLDTDELGPQSPRL